MKTRLFNIITLLFCIANISHADVLTPNKIRLNNKSTNIVYYELTAASLYFDEEILVDKSVKSKIMCGDGIVGEGAFEYFRDGAKDIELVCYMNTEKGEMWFRAEKGNKYRIIIPAKAICSKEDPNKATEEINIDFIAPEYLHNYGFSLDSSYNPTSADYAEQLKILFPTEIEHVEGAEISLYEDGQLFKTFPIRGTWDYGAGYVNVDFTRIDFKNNCKYSFLLKRGSIHHLYDENLINDDITIEFYGTHVDETGIVETADKPIGIVSDGTRLAISNLATNDEIKVNTIDGRLIERVVAKTGSAIIDLPEKGCYIVKTGKSVKKILCR